MIIVIIFIKSVNDKMKLYTVLVISLILSTKAWCGLNPAEQSIVQEQQKLILEDAQKQRESLQKSFNIHPEILDMPVEQSNLCFPINEIRFKDANHLSLKIKQNLTYEYLNNCLTIEQIQFLVKSITNYYIGEGFITTRAYLEEQDISSGILVISVIEGKIEAISLDGLSPTILNMVFPNMKNSVLNLRDIEQGLEQLNRLRSQKISINILPSEIAGYSLVELKSNKVRILPIFLETGINNSGQKSTGIGQNTLSITVENPLQIADIWSISASINNDFRNQHTSRNLSTQLSIPLGYWTIDYLYSGNYFYYDIPLVFDKWRYKGKSDQHRLMLNKVVYRDNQTKFSFTTHYSHKTVNNTFANEKLIISSPTLNTITLGLNYSTVLKNGYFTFNPTVVQGLHLFDSTTDKLKINGSPKSQFTKLTVSSSYYKPLSSSSHYLTSLYAQWSKQNLYSTERISIGGEYSVRGFKESSLTGNQGFYWRNELTYQASVNSFIRSISLTGAIDSGWIKHKNNQIDGGNMTGIAFGISLSDNNYYNASLSIGKPLFYPAMINPDHWVSYFQLSLNF
ncbi:ShlB/FhaC/HecB family hemolysin secretion/activation protein [Orbus sasakiae]|uniref:ShlB/FhaC/HecB family hemolysin secretion/activation protein n=2 Tax=Orbus sasakiae TaxID=1078475 RepID=A0ABP9N7S6_9GAMM